MTYHFAVEDALREQRDTYVEHASHLVTTLNYLAAMFSGKKVTRARLLRTLDGYSLGICDQILSDLEKDFPFEEPKK